MTLPYLVSDLDVFVPVLGGPLTLDLFNIIQAYPSGVIRTWKIEDGDYTSIGCNDCSAASGSMLMPRPAYGGSGVVGNDFYYTRDSSNGVGRGYGIPARFTVELYDTDHMIPSTTLVSTTELTMGPTDIDSTRVYVPADYTDGSGHLHTASLSLVRIEFPWILP